MTLFTPKTENELKEDEIIRQEIYKEISSMKELRIGQLFENIRNNKGDLFYISNEKLLKLIIEYKDKI